MKIIVGLGKTGLSIASLFVREDVEFAIMDSRLNPPMLNEFKKLGVDAPCYLGGLNSDVLSQASEIIVSPGVSLQESALKTIPLERIIGDIELFARRATAPVVAITGTNGKSTVTTLFASMCECAEKRVLVGGNIGAPVLDLLNHSLPDVFVLELSSFQLAVTRSLKTKAAVILNITEDHLDWHGSMDSYVKAKHKIFNGCESPVINALDSTVVLTSADAPPVYYNDENAKGFSVSENRYITLDGRRVLDVNDCDYAGAHYAENAVAALSLGLVFDLPLDAMLQAINAFKGLPHRTQWIDCIAGVNWFNDSKGTNIAATLAAINSLGNRVDGGIILIAGGSDKQADFTALSAKLTLPLKAVFLLGETRIAMAEALKPYTQVVLVDNMEMAVELAAKSAVSGDCVLLSPACASFDKYQNFEQRGQHYRQCVKENTIHDR